MRNSHSMIHASFPLVCNGRWIYRVVGGQSDIHMHPSPTLLYIGQSVIVPISCPTWYSYFHNLIIIRDPPYLVFPHRNTFQLLSCKWLPPWARGIIFGNAFSYKNIVICVYCPDIPGGIRWNPTKLLAITFNLFPFWSITNMSYLCSDHNVYGVQQCIMYGHCRLRSKGSVWFKALSYR